jgi:tetratricopeptide (TPR) repeat protein
MRKRAAVVVTVLLVGFAALAQDSTPPAAPGDQEARKARLAERDRLAERAGALEKAGEVEDAVQTLEAVLAIEREVFGEVHEHVAGTLGRIARLEKSRGRFTAARTAQDKVLAIRTQLLGASHWQVTDARLELEDLRRWEGLTAEQRARLREAKELNRAVFQLWRNGAYRKAVPKAKRALAIRREVLGSHRLTAESCFNLGAQYAVLGAHDRAEPLFHQAREIYRLRREPEQPRFPLQLRGRIRAGGAALPAGAGDLQEGAGRAAPQLRPEPEQPRRALPVHGRVRAGGAALSGRSGKRRWARSTRTTPGA